MMNGENYILMRESEVIQDYGSFERAEREAFRIAWMEQQDDGSGAQPIEPLHFAQVDDETWEGYANGTTFTILER